jgi:hypothetical protein
MVRLPKLKKPPSGPKLKLKGESPPTAAPPRKGVIRGEIEYPWGTVAHATVTLGEKSVVSDGAGKYEISGLDPGDYRVEVKVPFPGYETTSQSAALVGDEEKVVDFYLDFEKTIVHGFVYGPEAKPIAGAAVSGGMSGKDVETALTDEKGYFKFDRASPGYQFIRVNARGYVGQNQDFTAKRNEETKLDFHLVLGSCKIYGLLLDENEKPLEGELVLSLASGVILQTTQSSAATGYYEFAVLPDTYNVLAKGPEHQSKGWRGPVSAHQKLDFRLELRVSLRMPQSSGSGPTVDLSRIRSGW